jgi:uncharacterized protein YuzE
MRLRVDQENDALYLRLDESRIMESEEVQPGVVLDFDENGKVVGVEIMGLKDRVPIEALRQLHFEAA